MLVIMTQKVPGYQTGTKYSVSDDLGIYLISGGLARAETDAAQKAVLMHIAKNHEMRSESDQPETVPEPKPKKRKKSKKAKNEKDSDNRGDIAGKREGKRSDS